MNVDPSDEKLHAPGTDPYWQESFVFNFYDDGGQWAGLTRIESAPPRPGGGGIVGVCFPDGSVGVLLMRGQPIPLDGPLAGGSLLYTCEEPLRKWRVTFDGDVAIVAKRSDVPALWDHGLMALPRRKVAIDFTYEALHEPVRFKFIQTGKIGLKAHLARLRNPGSVLSALAFPERLKLALRMGPNEHYEQACSVSGTLRVDGTTHMIRGWGPRDHSWGIRHWNLPRRWRWMCARFDDGSVFSVMRIELLGSLFLGGYVWADGKLEGLASGEIASVMDESGIAARTLAIDLVTTGGAALHITGEAVNGIPLPTREGGQLGVLTEGHARFHWNGRVGYGVSEFMEQVSR